LVPRKKKILQALDARAASCRITYEACRAAALDANNAPYIRERAAHAAREALERCRDYETLAAHLRAGLIGRHDDNFLSMYS
jgi:hypothetical protein